MTFNTTLSFTCPKDMVYIFCLPSVFWDYSIVASRIGGWAVLHIFRDYL